MLFAAGCNRFQAQGLSVELSLKGALSAIQLVQQASLLRGKGSFVFGFEPCYSREPPFGFPACEGAVVCRFDRFFVHDITNMVTRRVFS